MRNAFTVHCIPWEACAPLLQEVRVAASELSVISHVDALTDDWDESSRHAIAVSNTGQIIGCARLRADGCIERIAVLPHEHREMIKAALIEVLQDYSQSISSQRTTIVDPKSAKRARRLSV